MKTKILSLFLSICLFVTAIMPMTAFAGEQLGQNTFDEGVGIPWHVCESGPAKLDFNIDGGTYNITIKNPGGAARGGESRWDCQFRHRNLKIVAGHSYTVKFEVTASNSGQLYTKIGNLKGDIEVWHNGSNDSNFDQLWTPISINANQKYTCNTTFTAKQTIDVAEWAFHFGGAGEYQGTDCFPVGTTLKFDNLHFIDNTSSENDYIHEAEYKRTGVLVNQMGYYPEFKKQATVVVEENDMTAKEFMVVDINGTFVYTGTTTPVGFDKDSGDWVHIADFSALKTEGTDYAVICDGKMSHPFNIGNYIYDGVLTNAMNYYYQNRSGINIESKYITSGDASTLAHQGGHMTDNAYIQDKWVKSYLADGSDVQKTKTQNVTGGWYDAGDHGKYVVNGGISVWMLNNIYERSLVLGNATKWADNSGTVVIPESGNDAPDILDETRYEVEWFFTMLVKDGSYKNMVYHKMHDHKWTGLAVKPWDYESEWGTIRIIKPASTAATLNFVACAAQSYRLWKNYDSDFANQCIEQAKLSYEAAKANPSLYAPLDQAIGGGAYGDDNVKDDFYWAACELYAATGDEKYYNDLKSYEDAFVMSYSLDGGENNGSCTSFNWGNTAGLGNLTLYLLCEDKLTETEYNSIKNSIINTADHYIDIENEQGYGIPYVGTTFTDPVNLGEGVEVEGYEWGSNSMVVNNAVVMAYAYDITKDTNYANGVSTAMDYIYGRNPLEYSFVTGYGEHAYANPHHRYWSYELDSDFPMAPAGVLSGGPNSGMQDPYILGAGYKRGEVAPQLCYVDSVESWSTNEVTINWNAPLAWITSWLEDTAKGVEALPDTDTETETDTDTDADTETDTNKFLLGDVNLDGKLNILDVVLTRAHIVNSKSLNEIDLMAQVRADMNKDNKVNIVDIVMMRSYIVNNK